MKTKQRILIAINWFLATGSSEAAGPWQWVWTLGSWGNTIADAVKCPSPLSSSSRTTESICCGDDWDDSIAVLLVRRIWMLAFCLRRLSRSLMRVSSVWISYSTSESTHPAIFRDWLPYEPLSITNSGCLHIDDDDDAGNLRPT